jgi:hypothetical protein
MAWGTCFGGGPLRKLLTKRRRSGCRVFILEPEQFMRFIPTSVHAVADYLVGFGMILLAFISGAEGAGFAAFVLLGLLAVVYALMTDYELGWKPYLTMPTHLALDAVFAVVMLLLPLVVTLPPLLATASLVIAVMAMVLVATTRMRPRNRI